MYSSDVHMYADNVQVYFLCPPGSTEASIEKVNEDLDKIYKWTTNNGLRLNPNKSKALIIQNRTARSHNDVCIRLGVLV